MHFLKLLVESWFLFGVITLIVGLVWTSRLGKASSRPAVPYSTPKRQPEFEGVALAKVRSA